MGFKHPILSKPLALKSRPVKDRLISRIQPTCWNELKSPNKVAGIYTYSVSSLLSFLALYCTRVNHIPGYLQFRLYLTVMVLRGGNVESHSLH